MAAMDEEKLPIRASNCAGFMFSAFNGVEFDANIGSKLAKGVLVVWVEVEMKFVADVVVDVDGVLVCFFLLKSPRFCDYVGKKVMRN